jgi:hypothetical protein
MKRFLILATVVAILILTTTARAAATKPPEHRVTICHATPPDTATNGWITITVDVASAGYQHAEHQSEHDADIIPPYTYETTTFAGQGNQSILANGCKLIPTAPPVVTTTTSTLPEQPVVTTTTSTLPEHTCEQLGTCTVDIGDPAKAYQNTVPNAPVSPVCTEDMPCWNCSTMGNRICGKTVSLAETGNSRWVLGAEVLIGMFCLCVGLFLALDLWQDEGPDDRDGWRF